MPYDKIINAECITGLQIGHLRESEGYVKTWFDEEQVPKQTEDFHYTVTVPSSVGADSDIYITVESYYQFFTPHECFNNWAGVNYIYFKVTN